MEAIQLTATARTVTGKKVRDLRNASLVPGVVYGHGFENKNVAVSLVPFEKVLAKAGESTLVDLVVDDATPFKVLIHEVQRDPVTSVPRHVDFFHVSMTEKLSTHIPIVFIGESKAVKELGGTLVKTLDAVAVECLPQDLVHELSVDLASLENFDDALRVADLKVPAGIEITSDPEEMIVTVKAPRTEEEIAADETVTAEVKVEDVEVEKKGKKEEEGEAAESAKE